MALFALNPAHATGLFTFHGPSGHVLAFAAPGTEPITATVDQAGATQAALDWARRFYHPEDLDVIDVAFEVAPTRFWQVTFSGREQSTRLYAVVLPDDAPWSRRSGTKREATIDPRPSGRGARPDERSGPRQQPGNRARIAVHVDRRAERMLPGDMERVRYQWAHFSSLEFYFHEFKRALTYPKPHARAGVDLAPVSFRVFGYFW